jgi:hypothetical protein
MRHPPSNQGENSGRKNDFFLGGVKIQPTFEAKMEDQVLNIVGGTGMMHLQLYYKPQQVILSFAPYFFAHSPSRKVHRSRLIHLNS